jgi:hypothetical protein
METVAHRKATNARIETENRTGIPAFARIAKLPVCSYTPPVTNRES